jgi:hypothetical protein
LGSSNFGRLDDSKREIARRPKSERTRFQPPVMGYEHIIHEALGTSLKLIICGFAHMVTCKWFEGSTSTEFDFCNICRDKGNRSIPVIDL